MWAPRKAPGETSVLLCILTTRGPGKQLRHLFHHTDQKKSGTDCGKTSTWKEGSRFAHGNMPMKDFGRKRRNALRSHLYFWQGCQKDPDLYNLLLLQMTLQRIDICGSRDYVPKASRTIEILIGFGVWGYPLEFIFTCLKKHAISSVNFNLHMCSASKKTQNSCADFTQIETQPSVP